jgi:hypothetical protein
MPLYAGLDRSGTPDLKSTQAGSPLYVVCLAAVEDMEAFGRRMSETRFRFGMGMRAEFHGHQTSDRMQAAVIEEALAVGLRVGVLVVDKEATRQQLEPATLPSPADFQLHTAVALLEQFLSRYALEGLWCDEDIRGKARQQEFVTAVKRLHRANWPERHLKVRHRPSDSSDLIQLADVVAYGLHSLSRGAELRPELKPCLEAIWADAQNVILGPMAWNVGEDR